MKASAVMGEEHSAFKEFVLESWWRMPLFQWDVLYFIVWFVQAFALNDMLESCALIFSLKLNGIGLHTYFLRSVSINKSSYQTLTTLFALEPIRQF